MMLGDALPMLAAASMTNERGRLAAALRKSSDQVPKPKTGGFAAIGKPPSRGLSHALERSLRPCPQGQGAATHGIRCVAARDASVMTLVLTFVLTHETTPQAIPDAVASVPTALASRLRGLQGEPHEAPLARALP